MSIVITSKLIGVTPKFSRRRRDPLAHLKRIKGETNRLRSVAIVEGITEALLELVSVDLGLFSKTVARKTGKLRKAVFKAVKEVVGRITQHRGKTVINWQDIVAGILSRDTQEYFIYHIRGRGFYKNPSVKGTFPIRFSRFKPMARNKLRRTIDKKLIKFGIQDRVSFTV